LILIYKPRSSGYGKWCVRLAIIVAFLQWLSPPLLTHSYNGKKVFKIIIIIINLNNLNLVLVLDYFQKKCLLKLLHPNVFCMAPFLHFPSVQNAPCPHRSNLYNSGGFLRHVKSAHPHASLIS